MIERSAAGYASGGVSNFFNNIIEKLKLSQENLLQYGIAIGVGFLTGFLLKKFSSYVAVVIAGCLLIIVLSHFGVMNVVIDWEKMQSLIGLETIQISDQNIFEIIWQWVRLHISLTLCALVGFFIGLKLG